MPKKINQPDDPGLDVLEVIKANQMAYKTRWNVYHTLLCIGVWGIFACTLWGVFKGWR